MTERHDGAAWRDVGVVDAAGSVPGHLLGRGVVLRNPSEADVDVVVELARDDDVLSTRWLPVGHRCSRSRAAEFIGELQRGWLGVGPFGPTFVLAETPEGEIRGVVFLQVLQPHTFAVAYGVAPAHRNRGLARRALRLLCDWATPAGWTLELHIAQSNAASLRVAHAEGFLLIGTTPDQFEDFIYRREPCAYDAPGSASWFCGRPLG